MLRGFMATFPNLSVKTMIILEKERPDAISSQNLAQYCARSSYFLPRFNIILRVILQLFRKKLKID